LGRASTRVRAGQAGAEEERQEEFFEKVPVAKRSFTDQLMGQLRIATDDQRMRTIGDYIIGARAKRVLTYELEIANTFSTGRRSTRARVIQSSTRRGGPENAGACSCTARAPRPTRWRRPSRDRCEFKQKKYVESPQLRVTVQELGTVQTISTRPKPDRSRRRGPKTSPTWWSRPWTASVVCLNTATLRLREPGHRRTDARGRDGTARRASSSTRA
jgi:hypothetical protein